MAAAFAEMLPGLLDSAKDNPLSFNSLMNLAGYEVYGKQMQQQQYQNQLNMQANAFRQFNTVQQNQFGQQNTMQQNMFAQQGQLQQNFFDNSRSMQSTQIKGQLANSAIQAGSNFLGSGMNLLGGYLNYKYASNLSAQQSEENVNEFNSKFNTVSNSYEQQGLPGFLAAGNTNVLNSMPRTSQVLNGINARTSVIPTGNLMPYTGSQAQIAMGTGSAV